MPSRKKRRNMRTAAAWRCTHDGTIGPRSSPRCPIALHRHRRFSCPDPVGNPVPVKPNGVADAHMGQATLAHPVTNRLRMKSQDFAQVFDIEQARLAFEFFGKGFWHAAKIPAIGKMRRGTPEDRVPTEYRHQHGRRSAVVWSGLQVDIGHQFLTSLSKLSCSFLMASAQRSHRGTRHPFVG